jgi:quercetin dioxygenase-like cupin family protein
MAKVSFATVDSSPVVAPANEVAGNVETRGLFARDKDPLQLRHHHLQPGAKIHFKGKPSDKVIFVWKGEVEAGGARKEPRSSAIVEYGSDLTVTAGKEGAQILEFTPKERSGDDRAGGHVHLMPNENVNRTISTGGAKKAGMALHANAHCPTCKVWLHENEYWDADAETSLHSHSEDEVMFVTKGSMRVGNKIYPEGSALSVAANTIYGFFSGPDGLAFVNFRNSSPTYTTADGKTKLDEADLWRKACGDPKPLSPR